MQDIVQKILFKNANVRGGLVSLSNVWHDMLAHKAYPAPVTKLLGEMTAATVLLSANIKFEGATVLQIHGDGPIRLLVVECSNTMQVRATAKLDDTQTIAEDATFQDLVNAHGKARCVVTLDPHDKIPGQRPYQGIIPLEGATVSEVIENYMKRSEQLDTRVWLAADANNVRGVILQRMPAQLDERGVALTDSAKDEEDWRHLVALGSTLTPSEMLATDIATLQHRLFWEQETANFEPLKPTFQCSCSREKVGNMLKMLGQSEVEEALKEKGSLTINCDYCGKAYTFDVIDCKTLFSSASSSEAAETRH
ncbi:MAG: Hsp33 family molecular chaperone HslO [Oxalobacter sp.]|jgi:molecular chaperone Hsp33|nr:Hsp33 family molecular chaperone HslO [Oxalobacter sp.]